MIETRFKETELGPIPEDWEIVKLGDYATNFTGLTYSPEDVHSYGTLVLRSSNILNGELDFSDCVYVTCKIPERALAHEGDILICVRNGSSRLIGKSAMIRTNERMAFGAFMTVIRATDKISNFYLNYYWQSPLLQSQINDNKGNIINQITSADINRYLLVLPPTKEQKIIGDVFKKIDELISGIKELIDKKRSIKEGAMYELLTGKKRLPGFDEPWTTKTMGKVGIVFSNNSLSRDQLCTSGTIRNIHYGDILTKFGAIVDPLKENLPFIKPEFEEKFLNKESIEDGDIIFADTAEDETVGKAIEMINVSERIVSGLHTIWFRPLVKFGKRFLGYLLNSNVFHDQIPPLASGVKVCSISKPNLLNLKITFPSNVKEQQAIADILSSMDSEIEALENKLNKYEQIKQGMMQQLLTGKIRLI